MSACPLNNVCSLGNCQFCSEKEDCILVALLKKLENLELLVMNMAGQTA